MSLRNHVQIDVVATLVCAGCGNIYDASDYNERAAENAVVHDAESDGWVEIDGKPYCDAACKKAAEYGE
jgi:hypothetical protein